MYVKQSSQRHFPNTSTHTRVPLQGVINSSAVARDPEGWATNAYNATYQNDVQAFFFEILLTCILVTVILSSMADCDGKNQFTWIFMVFTVAGNTFAGSVNIYGHG